MCRAFGRYGSDAGPLKARERPGYATAGTFCFFYVPIRPFFVYTYSPHRNVRRTEIRTAPGVFCSDIARPRNAGDAVARHARENSVPG